MAEAQAHVFISGRVQGVSFRYYTYHESVKRGLRGWVRNLSDGRVEAVFQGEKEAIDGLLKWSHSGPPAATVDKVDVEWEPHSDSLERFEIKANAA